MRKIVYDTGDERIEEEDGMYYHFRKMYYVDKELPAAYSMVSTFASKGIPAALRVVAEKRGPVEEVTK